MRLISIVLSLTALGFASGAIAHSPSIDRKIAQQQNAKGEYAEKAPYRPCPTVASINGRNVCLGCPGRCQWPPSFANAAPSPGSENQCRHSLRFPLDRAGNALAMLQDRVLRVRE